MTAPSNQRFLLMSDVGVANGVAAINAAGKVVDAAGAEVGVGGTGLTIGTTSTTAKRGDYVPTWAEVTSKPTTFAPVIGTTAATAKAGDYIPTWAEITSKPTTFAPTIGTTATTAKPGNYVPTWTEVTGKPTVYPADLTGLTKANVGLANVDNTDDMSKPVSAAQQQALDDLEATFPTALSQLTGTTTTAQVAPGTVMRALWSGTAWPASPAGGRTDISIWWVDELGTSTQPPIVAGRGDVYLKKV